ncbi:YiiX/YebB-like N1pC/P60 family cysteine hydrolase [Vibrio comitans]
MKGLLLLVIFLLVGCTSLKYSTLSEPKNLGACADPNYEWKPNLTLKQLESSAAIKTAVNDYITLNEHMLSHREEMFVEIKNMKADYSVDNPVPSWALNKLNQELVISVELAYQYEEVLQDNYCWYGNLQTENLDYSSFIGFMLELSSALALYDTYMQVSSVTEENERISRFLNQSDKGYEKPANALSKYTQNIQDLANIKRLSEQVSFYQNSIENYPKLENYPQLWYLKLSIEQSPTFQKVPDIELSKVMSKRFSNNVNLVTYDLEELNRSAVNGISGFFGNVTGLFESRTGYLYNSPMVLQDVTSNLKAGDILLEKTPFRLTDKVIPGYWGHAAVWVGNEQELRELGIWQHPVVVKYHEQIQQGHLVAEALRSGVQLSTLDHFMNVDDLALIRVTNQTKTQKQQVIINTLRQIGKEYDFNFDVETTDKIVCSQLVYIAYSDINWSTDRVAGRYTISPDAIAKQALSNERVELELLYLNSNKVEQDLLPQMSQVLLAEE